MKYKITSVHYIESTDRYSAEAVVESGMSSPDRIESEPASQKPEDIVLFGIGEKIAKDHHDMFFTAKDPEQYTQNLLELKKKTTVWLRSLVEQIIANNESNWT